MFCDGIEHNGETQFNFEMFRLFLAATSRQRTLFVISKRCQSIFAIDLPRLNANKNLFLERTGWERNSILWDRCCSERRIRLYSLSTDKLDGSFMRNEFLFPASSIEFPSTTQQMQTEKVERTH